MSRVIVIGGGAAGMMAAIAAAQKGHQLLLLEKNEKLGKKIYITGKGRCNLTNACETQELFDSVVSNPRFLYSAIYGFDNAAVQDFFEKRGCPLKVERGNRVFPVSDHSSDIIRTLAKELERLGVTVRLHAPVQEILVREDNEPEKSPGQAPSCVPSVRGVRLSSGEELPADAVILCSGGLSYPATGSTGDGHRMAQRLGHTLIPCEPALVPFCVEEEWCADLQGLALKNVSASLFLGKKKVYEGFGEMLFTHFGVSGPLILSASSYYRTRPAQTAKGGKKKAEEKAAPEAVLRLDLKPALSEEQLDRRLIRDFEEAKNRQFRNAVEGLFPARLIPVMIALSGIDPEKRVHDITRQERQGFAARIKNVELHVTGTRGFPEAIITRGGVSVREVNPSTMESRLVSGLYFAGELLDLDALTGGFNLQIAWSTGYLAGENVP
ncbi:MAG TPA: NAD(P)/FAD-dependent oxidoreductase [Candidatus Eisenbergiella merdavium]|uniref:NAD(P)/FAD-dependent oxidoreductase n=1 Tax=Candidatus Eisenbergiella merdavium TaxID=2838551 RepID=A0A9D2SRA1_9FIRM|nr:NAD(P)/FAD-dependent oxidoreductase [Candidatus Eisenbergiella merdavium]